MKLWPLFVVCTIVCWGAYVPMIHHGQMAFEPKNNSALRAFLFVGAAYFLMAGLTFAYLILSKSEPLLLTRQGVTLSTIAGILGAIGALGIVFAIKSGGTPLAVAPLVFAGAPVVNTLVSMLWDKPKYPPHWMFYFGIVLAGVGAAVVLRFKPV